MTEVLVWMEGLSPVCEQRTMEAGQDTLTTFGWSTQPLESLNSWLGLSTYRDTSQAIYSLQVPLQATRCVSRVLKNTADSHQRSTVGLPTTKTICPVLFLVLPTVLPQCGTHSVVTSCLTLKSFHTIAVLWVLIPHKTAAHEKRSVCVRGYPVHWEQRAQKEEAYVIQASFPRVNFSEPNCHDVPDDNIYDLNHSMSGFRIHDSEIWKFHSFVQHFSMKRTSWWMQWFELI